MQRSAPLAALALGAALLAPGIRSPGAVAAMPGTPAQADGRAVFEGKGNCAGCHGSSGAGTPMGPDLTDAEWLHIDGSYEAIVALLTKGVPVPKKARIPMPPMGGAELGDDEVAAVARYVYGLATSPPTPAPRSAPSAARFPRPAPLPIP